MRVIITLIFSILAGAAAAQAPKPVKTGYETSWHPPDRSVEAEAVAWLNAGLEISGSFHVWYLLGEPVVNCTARTETSGKLVEIRADDGGLLETAGEGEVEVYNLLLAYAAPDPRGGEGRQIVVFCDAGVVAQNGHDGFNVAGSPSWDQFICAVGRGYSEIRLRFTENDFCKAIGGGWIDAVGAKSIAGMGLNSRKVGLSGAAVKVLKAEVSGIAVMKRVEKRLWREKSAAFKRGRASAYFADFPALEDEGTADWSARKNDALRRLPDLPMKDPSADELAAFEEAWLAILAETPAGGAFTKKWREKEKALVGGQLARMKALDKAAAQEEEAYFNYISEVSRRKKTEPVELDPMAAYRTDTPLTAYAEGSNSSYVCGLKRPDGSVAIPGAYYRRYYGGCPVQAVTGYDIYKVALEKTHPALAPGGLLDNDPVCTYKSGCAIFYDRNGNILHKAGIEINPDTNRSNLAFSYGLIVANREGGGMYVYSLLSKKILLELSAEVFPTRNGWSREYVSATAVLRNGRPALVLSIHGGKDHGCGWDNYAYAYLFIDSERVEEVGLCVKPSDDPLNQKIE